MSDPIEILRAACEQIKRSTGDRRPRSIDMHQAVYERYREWYIENIARAERLLGIGCVAQGTFSTGWPWTKRAGRMSREEKQLRENLPRWRRALAGMPPSKPIRTRNGGRLLLRSANESGGWQAILLSGDRRGGKTVLIDEAREDISNSTAQMMAVLHRHPDGQEMTRTVIVPPETDTPGRWVHNYSNIAVRRAERRPTGKRAQRRAGKEWNR